MSELSPLLQTLTRVAAHVAEMERQIDELTQTTIEQRARIENYEAELRGLRENAAGSGLSIGSELEAWLVERESSPDPTPGLWLLPHRGDPCVYCKQPMGEVGAGGCPVTVEQLYSRIGELHDQADGLWGKAEGKDAFRMRAARALEEEGKRVKRLHQVLTEDMVPAGANRG